MLIKSLNGRRSVRELEDQYYELNEYFKRQPKQTTAKRVKLMSIIITGTGVKILPLKKLLTKRSVLMALIKAENNLYK